MALVTRATDLRDAYERIVAAMKKHRRVLVAFSGGIDSGLVARIAHDALADDALAVLADGDSLARWELRDAISEAAEIGIRLRTIRISELANDRYVANPTNRCYFCREDLGAALKAVAAEARAQTIADGVNLSDLGDDRPGIEAMNSAGFWHPLVEFRLAKPDVRALAKALGLSFHDKPSNACLSSRIPHWMPITVESLRQVEAAEDYLRDRGFRQVRVRHHGSIARIEVPLDEVARLRAIAGEVATVLESMGYREVVIDSNGYRSLG